MGFPAVKIFCYFLFRQPYPRSFYPFHNSGNDFPVVAFMRLLSLFYPKAAVFFIKPCTDSFFLPLFQMSKLLICPQLISYSLLCKWFQIAVLPLDKLLYAELFKTEDKKRCTECGTFFVSKSNSVKYCPDCRKRITRRQAAERMRKRRAAVTQ